MRHFAPRARRVRWSTPGHYVERTYFVGVLLPSPTMRALVVDDSAAMRRLLAEIVRERGYEVHAVGTGEEALAEHASAPFDLFLVDWTLPGLSGIELCRALRAAPRGDDATILVITGRSRPEDVHTVLDAGADDFVPKPIDADRLRTRLVVASRRSRTTSHAAPELGVLSSVVDAVLLVRGERVVDANVAAARGLGHDSVASLVGAALVSLVHADDRAAIASPGGPRRVRLRRRDGSFAAFDATSALDPRTGVAVVIGRVVGSTDRDARQLLTDRLACASLIFDGLATELGEPVLRALDALPPGEGSSERRHLEELVRSLSALADDDRERNCADPRAVLRTCLRLARATLRRRARVELDVGEVPCVALSSARLAQIAIGVVEALAPVVEDLAPATVRIHASTDPRGDLSLTLRARGPRPSPRALALLDPSGAPVGLAIARALTLHAGGALVVESTPDGDLCIEVRLPPCPPA